MKNENKFSFMLTMFLLVVSLLLTVGTAYSLWSYNHVQEIANEVKTGCFSINLSDKNSINLTNAYPMSDTKGLSLTPYEITIENTCSIDANFMVILNVLEGSTLSSSAIKYNVSGTNNLGPVILGTEDKKYTLEDGDTNLAVSESFQIFQGSLKAGKSATYLLNLWVDEAASNDVMSKTFTANVLVKSYATTVSAKSTLDAELLNVDSGLTTIDQLSTDLLANNTSYRYVGSDPHNYINFNNENWRIVGLFNVNNGSDVFEQRIKIVKDESIGDLAWDSNATTNYSVSTINTYLNDGYYNTLSEEAKNQISPSVIYLGQNSTDVLTANQLYLNERSYITTYQNSVTSNVSLLYASDYAYAFGSSCYDTDISTCQNNWLNNSSAWTLYSANNKAYYIDENGLSSDSTSTLKTIKPVVYLKAGIELECDSSNGICGSIDNPYSIKGE